MLVAENAITVDYHQTKAAFDAFVKAGLRVGISEFGVGYSSLSHLRSLPISYVAADRVFTKQIGRGEVATSLLPAISSLCKSLCLSVIGSRVSSRVQWETLRDADFDLAEVVPGELLTGSAGGS